MPNKRCHMCNGNHHSRDCPVEKAIAGYMKKSIGSYMENWIANNIECPTCHTKNMYVLGDNSPSLDLRCHNCNKNFECKSKCLSIKNLPDDIILNHGSYIDYKNRQSNGLDFFIIIYKIDRKTKVITIRRVLHVDNDYIVSNNNFNVVKKHDSNTSNILIKNHNYLNNLSIPHNHQFSFARFYDYIVNKTNVISVH